MALILLVPLSHWYYNAQSLHRVGPYPLFMEARLTQEDFNMTISQGCEFVNQTSGQNEVPFYLRITNRDNERVHYLSASADWTLITYPSQFAPVSFPNAAVLSAPTFTDKLTLTFTISSSLISEDAQFNLFIVNVVASVQELNGALPLISVTTISRDSLGCSLLSMIYSTMRPVFYGWIVVLAGGIIFILHRRQRRNKGTAQVAIRPSQQNNIDL